MSYPEVGWSVRWGGSPPKENKPASTGRMLSTTVYESECLPKCLPECLPLPSVYPNVYPNVYPSVYRVAVYEVAIYESELDAWVE